MDYVVAGFGIGAILALIGFALWELFGNVEEPGKNWLSRAAIGLMLGALVIWAVTGVSLISHIEDSMGSQLVLLTTLVTLIAVAGGTFWYWRADRALVATLPRPAAASAQFALNSVPTAPPEIEDIELTEWDSWPERDAGKPAASEAGPAEEAPAPSFEPEVAAAAPLPDEVEPAAPDTGTREAIPDLEPEPVLMNEQPSDVAADTKEPLIALPSKVLPFRALPKSPGLPPHAVLQDDVLIAEAVDIATVAPPVDPPEDAPEEAEAPAPPVENEEIAAAGEETPIPKLETKSEDAAADSKNSTSPTGFESSLLADIDGSQVDDDGGYRSPLLSDLGSDKLEGVGLAKWRPDAHLTEEQEDELHPPSKRGRRR